MPTTLASKLEADRWLDERIDDAMLRRIACEITWDEYRRELDAINAEYLVMQGMDRE